MKRNVIGMLGPINLADFRDYLYPDIWNESIPKGLGGTPVNLLSCELIRRGYKLVIFSLDHSVQDEVILEGPNLRICIGSFRPNRARDFFALERAYLLGAIKREKPTILHAQWTYEYALAAQASKLPYVITAHDAPISILRHNFIPYRIARTMMAYWVLIRARRVISVSPYVANHLRRFMLYFGKLEVIPNGMPARQFEMVLPDREKKEHVTFATILPGWGGLKNGQVAIEAFAIHRITRPKDKLIMFGHGHGLDEAAEAWAKSRGISDGIEFCGHTPYQTVIERLANEVDVLLHPSLEEAQPMVLIEAMALNIPVIGGIKSGGVPWTLDNGKAGLLVDVTSPSEVAGAMYQVACNDTLRLDIGTKGRELAMSRFHMDVITAKYEKIYKELLVQVKENRK